MVTDFFRLGRLRTTDQKAKELRRAAERLITKARADTLAARRRVAEFVRDKSVVKKLFEEIAPLYRERPGGYTRIVKLGVRRGDGAAISLVELVEEEYKPKPRKKKRAKKTASSGTQGKGIPRSAKKEAAKELGVLPEEPTQEGGGGGSPPPDAVSQAVGEGGQAGAAAPTVEAPSGETAPPTPEREAADAEKKEEQKEG